MREAVLCKPVFHPSIPIYAETATENSGVITVYAVPGEKGARYLDPRTSRWISTDPAMGEYIPSAPINDEAKKRNQNLPGMGGVFNYVNLHVYHYAGNNPIKLIDPDGRDIYSIMIGLGAKVVVGGSGSVGISWDDNDNIALTYSFTAGIGVEAEFKFQIAPSITITRGENIDDLNKVPIKFPSLIFGDNYYSAEASATGLYASAGIILGAVFQINEPGSGKPAAELSGGQLFVIGGGVDFVAFTLYRNFKQAENYNILPEIKSQLKAALVTNKDSMPTDIYDRVMKILE